MKTLLAGILSILVLYVSFVGIVFIVTILGTVIFPGDGSRAVANISAAANILGFILGLLVARWCFRKMVPNTNSKYKSFKFRLW